MFSSTLWDLEDVLKRIDGENMWLVVGKVTVYDYALHLPGYLENSILNENDRFSNFAGKPCKSKLHIDNYFYLLKMDTGKYLRELYRQTDDSSGALRRVVSAEAELIRCIGEIRACL